MESSFILLNQFTDPNNEIFLNSENCFSLPPIKEIVTFKGSKFLISKLNLGHSSKIIFFLDLQKYQFLLLLQSYQFCKNHNAIFLSPYSKDKFERG